MSYKARLRRFLPALAGLTAIAAAAGELAGATTAFVRVALAATLAGAALSVPLASRGAVPLLPVAAAALALHLWTYYDAPVGTLGLAADLGYWGALALGAVLGAARLVPR